MAENSLLTPIQLSQVRKAAIKYGNSNFDRMEFKETTSVGDNIYTMYFINGTSYNITAKGGTNSFMGEFVSLNNLMLLYPVGISSRFAIINSLGKVSIATWNDTNSAWKTTLLNPVLEEGTYGVISINDMTGVVNITKETVGLNNVTNDIQVKRSEMGVQNGIATLDANGKIPINQVPLTSTHIIIIANKAERLLLPIKNELTIALQADTQWMWALNANENPSIENNWIDCGSTSAQVISINNMTGAVTIDKTTVGLSNVKNIDTTDATNITSGLLLDTIIPKSSVTKMGGIIIGSGLSVDTSGVVSVSGASPVSMTTSQRLASNPIPGKLVYDSDIGCLMLYTNNWVQV